MMKERLMSWHFDIGPDDPDPDGDDVFDTGPDDDDPPPRA